MIVIKITKSGAVISQKIRKAARGEQCTLNIPDVCSYNPETVVLCHFPSDIKASKSSDLAAGFGCSDCHDVIDRRVNVEISDIDREYYMRRSQIRTQARLVLMGVLTDG